MPRTYQTDSAEEKLLDRVQRTTFDYFLDQVNPANGLIADKNKPGWPASIAAVGLALTAYPIAVERGFMERGLAVERTLTTLRTFTDSRQGTEVDAMGYKGFFYHWLDMDTGKRSWKCELSTVDSALFFAGALAAAAYFEDDTREEAEIRELADRLYRAADWEWARNSEVSLTHGWKPESGFLPHRWRGYDEAILLYVLGLGSPTFPLPPESYEAFTSTYAWKEIYDTEVLYAGPLFIHQLSHVWIDFFEIRDAPMRAHDLDYFENSRRATYLQQQYAIRNPREYQLYGEWCWGITASDGPGPTTQLLDGVERVFFDYIARGAPFGPDDGTISPWAVAASLPFAPEIVLPTLRYFSEEVHLEQADSYGFKATFNACFDDESDNPFGWVSSWNYGLNQGPIVMMIENFRSEFTWRQMRKCRYLVDGLRAAGFEGGWLG